jgi:acetyl-CoA carboxylase/biotin carboxylase 1
VVHEKVEAFKTESVAFDVASLLRGNAQGGLKGVRQVLSMLPVGEREEALKFLSQT